MFREAIRMCRVERTLTATMRNYLQRFAVVLCVTVWPAGIGSAQDRVERFAVLEKTFEHSGRYANPYVQLTATVTFTEPDGTSQRAAPLFWDGDATWRFRFAPDQTGDWSWSVSSPDPGLNGKSGTFRVLESQRSGSIRAMPQSGYHFQRQDGTPFWFLGDTAWALYTDSDGEKHNRESVVRYLDARASQGFNVLHSMLLSEAGWGNRGGPPFHDLDAERLNAGYWQEVDWRLAELNRRGLVAGLVLAWGDKRRVEPYAWRRFPSLAARLRYARYIAARYSAYDVYFLVSGEWHAEVRTRDGATEESIKDEFIAIGDALAEADPHRRTVAIHPMTSHGSVREFAGARWMAFGDYQQNYRQLHARILESRRFDRPVVNSEYAYFLRDRDGDALVDKDNSLDVDMIRHATWDILLAGGYVVTGFGTTYFGGNRDPGPFDVDAQKNDVWEEQVQHPRRLFSTLPWWRLEPADANIAASVPRGGDRTRRVERDGARTSVIQPPELVYWLLAEPGRTYVAYVRGHAETFRIKVVPGQYRVRRFDPRTGESQAVGEIRLEEEHAFEPPDEQDWVLVLERD